MYFLDHLNGCLLKGSHVIIIMRILTQILSFISVWYITVWICESWFCWNISWFSVYIVLFLFIIIFLFIVRVIFINFIIIIFKCIFIILFSSCVLFFFLRLLNLLVFLVIFATQVWLPLLLLLGICVTLVCCQVFINVFGYYGVITTLFGGPVLPGGVEWSSSGWELLSSSIEWTVRYAVFCYPNTARK